MTAAARPRRRCTKTLRAGQVDRLLTEALARWEAAGVDTSALQGIDVRIADLGGLTLGQAAERGHRAGRQRGRLGLVRGPHPANDSEFTRRGNQGERNRMDLLTVLTHEVGHLLGYDHAAGGVMQETLDAGVRRTLGPTTTTAADRPGAGPTLLVWNLDAMGIGHLVTGEDE